MKERDAIGKPDALFVSIVALLVLGWCLFLWREDARIVRETDLVIAGKIAQKTSDDRPLIDQDSKRHRGARKFGIRNPKRFSTDLKRKIWENTPDDQKAIDEAHAAGDFEEFDRLGRELAMKDPWEWEPEPWLKKLREENGWTNRTVIIETNHLEVPLFRPMP